MDLNALLKDEFDREVALSRRMLDAVPADADLTWKANPKNMPLGRLAAHVAETAGSWAIHTLTLDVFKCDGANQKPWKPADKAEILNKFDQETQESRELLAKLDPAKWNDNWKMVSGGQVWVSDTRYNVFRNWVLNHMIHHRAQLGRDLRTLGVSIPGTYGPSADQM
jgi:uncharacterized damage-inducible protein DinB